MHTERLKQILAHQITKTATLGVCTTQHFTNQYLVGDRRIVTAFTWRDGTVYVLANRLYEFIETILVHICFRDPYPWHTGGMGKQVEQGYLFTWCTFELRNDVHNASRQC
ncbi:hypothetical protein D3C81_1609780 [compost metagenome]